LDDVRRSIMTVARDAEERVAVVTGAARGIGAETAARLVADGRRVALVDLDSSAVTKVASDIGPQCIGIAADVSNEESVAAAIQTVVEELGPPTILVNNAGVIRDNLLFRMTLEDWDVVMNVHLRGTFIMTSCVQKYMVDARWGRIVNLSSTAALGNRGQTNYSAAKAGLQGLTKTLALELGPFGVTVNAVAPGFIVTEMTAKTAQRQGIDFSDFQRLRAEATPVRRVGHPRDVSAAIAFFASEEASFITGQVLYVAGGPRV
jgi:3-oxoacyl-[acyl-carrier protein] reductase